MLSIIMGITGLILMAIGFYYAGELIKVSPPSPKKRRKGKRKTTRR